MNEGFAIGQDPCHGFDHDPRSPYYVKRHTGLVCALCEEPIEEGEEYLRNTNEKTAHTECCRYNAPQQKVLQFLCVEMDIA